jgi:hypothetical protein
MYTVRLSDCSSKVTEKEMTRSMFHGGLAHVAAFSASVLQFRCTRFRVFWVERFRAFELWVQSPVQNGRVVW